MTVGIDLGVMLTVEDTAWESERVKERGLRGINTDCVAENVVMLSGRDMLPVIELDGAMLALTAITRLALADTEAVGVLLTVRVSVDVMVSDTDAVSEDPTLLDADDVVLTAS